MALDKNIKINTSSKFNFVMNGKQIKSLDDLPPGLKIASKMIFGNKGPLEPNSPFGKIAETLLNNPEIKQAILDKSVKIDPLTKKITYNGQEIKSLEDVPEPFKSMAKKALEDKNNNQIPDFIEGKVQEEITNKMIENSEPSKPSSQERIQSNDPYKALNVAGNPLSKLQFILLGIIILSVVIYFVTN